jgi:hypothetical protein
MFIKNNSFSIASSLSSEIPGSVMPDQEHLVRLGCGIHPRSSLDATSRQLKHSFPLRQASERQVAGMTRASSNFRSGIIKVCFFSMMFCFLAFSKASYAEAGSGTLIDLERLVKQEYYEEAFTISKNLSKKYSGEAHFDYLFALASIGAKHIEQALFPLERILLNDPNNISARFELARVYLALSDYVLAKFHLEYVRHQSTAPEFIALVDHYIAQSENKIKAQDWKFKPYIGLSYGRDSNISGITLNDSIYLNSLQSLITLDSGTARGYDFFYDAIQGFSAMGHITQHSDVYAELKVKERFYNTKAAFNEVDANLSVGLLFEMLPHTFRVPLQEEVVWLDHALYKKIHGAGLEWTYWASNQNRFITLVQFSASRFPQDFTQDINSFTTALSWSFSSEALPFVFTPSILYLTDHSLNVAGDYNGRVGGGASAQLDYSLTQYQLVSLNYTYMHTDHKGLDPLDLVYRHNNQAMISLGWNIKMNRYLDLLASANYLKNNTKVELYDYSRVQVSAGFKLNF